MPKDTFLNLPDEKRAHIEQVALAEFAEHGYDNASVNRIVAGAGIAKGSFYQYFEDKQDVLAYLITQIAIAKIDYMSPVLQNPAGHDFFTVMRELYRSGLAFARVNPAAAQVANQFLQNRNHPVYTAIYADSLKTAKVFYHNLLEMAIKQGNVRPDIDRRFVVHTLITLHVSIIEYYFEEVQGGDRDVMQLDDNLMDTVATFLDFIQHGLAYQEKGAAVYD